MRVWHQNTCRNSFPNMFLRDTFAHLVWHVSQVDYFNNKVICDLVELPHKGILAILDEACLSVGKVTDAVSHSSFNQCSKTSSLNLQR